MLLKSRDHPSELAVGSRPLTTAELRKWVNGRLSVFPLLPNGCTEKSTPPWDVVNGLVVNLSFIPLFIWMLRMPFTILAPMIFVLSIVGGYAATKDMHDVWLMLGFGLSAFFLRKFDYPLAPAVLAIVLGPIA